VPCIDAHVARHEKFDDDYFTGIKRGEAVVHYSVAIVHSEIHGGGLRFGNLEKDENGKNECENLFHLILVFDFVIEIILS